MENLRIERALLSVSNKEGIVEFAKKLVGMNIEILSTGGTAKILKDNLVPVISVDTHTGHPEIMDGRVKTLHPRIHGGILAIRNNASHSEQMRQNGIKHIDLVVVNLYPFVETISKPNVSIEEAVENIDIGGPAMVRSAAKNHSFVTVVVDPADYATVLSEMKNGHCVSLETRKKLAVKAYKHTAAYDTAIAAYLSQVYLGGK
jgi:phosphoribosylaminoimidazolecarboxamide formyltransferase / IMP cyclohydrolase